ncbi:MAG: hypothetical protein HC815_24955 [Richelia sp. RM1_1_1]|nr:hypothetical protein [Richelia sp. RM1_1_1]
MLKLSYEEIEGLQIILVEHCNGKSPNYLKSLIINSKIEQKTINVNYYLPTSEFTEILQAELSKTYSSDGDRSRLDFVLFLEYFQVKLPPESDERLFVKDIIIKLEKTPIFESHSRSKNLKTLLNQTRQQQSERVTIPSSNIYKRIDNSIIVDHDLEDLEDTLRRQLGYRGLFTFSISSDDPIILKEYIIERILREFSNKIKPRYCRHPINIRLYNNSVSTQQIIEEKLRQLNICNQLADLVLDKNKLDTIIILWNYDVEKSQMETIVNEFLSKIRAECLSLLQENRQCLVIILANVSCQFNIDSFISLKTPDKFILGEPNGLIEWVTNKLHQLNLENDDIYQYINRIEGQHGHLIGTYQEIKDIIDELNGRI